MDVAYIPSPSRGVWHLGPLPIRGYALCIILGVIAAVWISERRWAARGGRPGVIGEVAIWAVPFGIVGARIYHVITTPDPYFGDGGHPWEAFAIWKGGIGIWGAISMGALGAWIACRRQGVPLPAVADVAAPGIAVAQAIGRWGN
ncbi:MAG TPA: prolipoprotein diacylglyceryl transferase family protein, partial [Actinomycetes bacterium]